MATISQLEAKGTSPYIDGTIFATQNHLKIHYSSFSPPTPRDQLTDADDERKREQSGK